MKVRSNKRAHHHRRFAPRMWRSFFNFFFVWPSKHVRGPLARHRRLRYSHQMQSHFLVLGKVEVLQGLGTHLAPTSPGPFRHVFSAPRSASRLRLCRPPCPRRRSSRALAISRSGNKGSPTCSTLPCGPIRVPRYIPGGGGYREGGGKSS